MDLISCHFLEKPQVLLLTFPRRFIPGLCSISWKGSPELRKGQSVDGGAFALFLPKETYRPALGWKDASEWRGFCSLCYKQSRDMGVNSAVSTKGQRPAPRGPPRPGPAQPTWLLGLCAMFAHVPVPTLQRRKQKQKPDLQSHFGKVNVAGMTHPNHVVMPEMCS